MGNPDVLLYPFALFKINFSRPWGLEKRNRIPITATVISLKHTGFTFTQSFWVVRMRSTFNALAGLKFF